MQTDGKPAEPEVTRPLQPFGGALRKNWHDLTAEELAEAERWEREHQPASRSARV